MEDYVVNELAVVHAYGLIDGRHFVIGTDWSDSSLTTAQRAAFVEEHSWPAYGLWHLATDPSVPEGTWDHYLFPIGDLVRVHRSALLDHLAQAERTGRRRLADSCLELLRRLDAKAGLGGVPAGT